VTSSPRYRKGLPTWKLARLGVHPELHALSSCTLDRHEPRIPLLSLRSGLQDAVYLAEYLNLPHSPPLAYPLPIGRGLASNGKINKTSVEK